MCQEARSAPDPSFVVTASAVWARRTNPLKLLLVVSQGRNSTILIADTADRPARIEVILNLNGLPLRGCYIGGDSHKQIAGHPLLNRYSCSRVLAVACSERRIDLQLRDSCHLRDPVADLSADGRSTQRLRSDRK